MCSSASPCWPSSSRSWRVGGAGSKGPSRRRVVTAGRLRVVVGVGGLRRNVAQADVVLAAGHQAARVAGVAAHGTSGGGALECSRVSVGLGARVGAASGLVVLGERRVARTLGRVL